MYCNITTGGGAVLQQIHNTCIVIPMNYFTATVILLYILVIKLY